MVVSVMIDDNLQGVAFTKLFERHLGNVVAYQTWVITDRESILHLLTTLYRPDEALILYIVRFLAVNLCGLIQVSDVRYTFPALVYP